MSSQQTLLLYLFFLTGTLSDANILKCTAGEPQMTKAIPLVYTTSAQNEAGHTRQTIYHVNDNALKTMSELLKDNFEIISFIGQARKGKSTTSSKVAQVMTGTSVFPFEASSYNEPLTDGIWMYPLPSCESCDPDKDEVVNVTLNADGDAAVDHSYPCTHGKKSYILLDTEGSDTDKGDETLRYAVIVTMLSSQTYLFLHEKLYQSNADQIALIQAVVQKMNDERIDFGIEDINLGAIVREPFKSKAGDLKRTVNDDLFTYLKSDLVQFTAVLPISHLDSADYDSSVQRIADYMAIHKASRMQWITADKFGVFLKAIVEQLNSNQDLSAVCLSCPWTRVVEWLPFGQFGDCSAKCDGGNRERSRGCNTGNINDCEGRLGGKAVETETCNTFKCEWLPFEWSTCSKACNGGIQEGVRQCSTGDMADCKAMFDGSEIDSRTCNEQRCEWSAFAEWSECSQLCGEGTQRMYRTCESGEDADCEGDSYEERTCHLRKCLWEYIGRWSECTKQCGGGEKQRYRRCETGTDSDCDGLNYEVLTCGEHECVWKERGDYGPCMANCGYGKRKVYRYCETGKDEDCNGENFRTETCYAGSCDDDDDDFCAIM